MMDPDALAPAAALRLELERDGCPPALLDVLALALAEVDGALDAAADLRLAVAELAAWGLHREG